MEARRDKGQEPSRGRSLAAGRGKDNFFDDTNDDDFSSYFSKKNKTTNPFEEDEDADLMSTTSKKSPVSGRYVDDSSYSGIPEEKPVSARELYLQEVQAIKERTLDTTHKSLRLIDESEAIGTVAAQVRQFRGIFNTFQFENKQGLGLLIA
jgi:hypothetical protein